MLRRTSLDFAQVVSIASPEIAVAVFEFPKVGIGATALKYIVDCWRLDAVSGLYM